MINKTGGDNPALAFLTVLGNQPPSHVTINEITTVASVWTHAQFIDGTRSRAMRSASDRGRKRAELRRSGNRRLGAPIQDPLNSGQTPTMANFATLADLFAGCATRVTPMRAASCSRPRRRPRRRAHRHTGGGAVDRSLSLVPARADSLRCSIKFYPVPHGQEPAAGSVHALPELPHPAPGCCH